MIAIKTNHLTCVYGKDTPFEKTAIEDINIEIEQGELVGVIGHTGSGKSTLMQHLNGLIKPSSGEVFISGENMWEKPKEIRKFRFKVGLVFQYPEQQLFKDNVFDDIAFGPENMGLSKEDVKARVIKAAKFVGLKDELLQKSPFELSGGEKRRVAIAGVIAMEPEVLILDEPTAGLDPMGRNVILDQIKRYQQEMKNTVLLVSHSMEDVARVATKVLVMNNGKIAMYGSVPEVFARAEELKSMSLDIPKVTEIFIKLNKMGYPVNPSVYNTNMARDEIISLLNSKK